MLRRCLLNHLTNAGSLKDIQSLTFEATAVRPWSSRKGSTEFAAEKPAKLPKSMDPLCSAKFPKCESSIEALRSQTLPAGFHY